MNRTVTGNWILLALAVALAGASLAGCSGDENGHDVADAGSVGFALSLPSGATVDNVDYTLNASNGTVVKMGSFSVSGPGKTFTYTLPGVPAGMGYTISLKATSSDSRNCVGKSMAFNVAAGQSVNVAVVLSCQGKGTAGSVILNGTLNICPVSDSAVASPASAAVGSTIALTGSGSDEDTGPSALTYAWSASGSAGTITNGTTANATFTCNSAGTSTITLTSSDGDTQCTGNTLTVDVTCTGGGTGGAGAAGTIAGAGGAGAGGTAAGAGGTAAGAGGTAAGAGGTTAGAGGTAAGAGGTAAGAGGTAAGAGGSAAGAGGSTAGAGGSSGGACTTCEAGNDVCAMRATACSTATGNTASGMPKSVVCQQVLDCIRTSKCASATGSASDCICGPGADVGVCAGKAFADVTGACKDIIATGADSQMLTDISNRLGDPQYATGLAIQLIQCDQIFCADSCSF